MISKTRLYKIWVSINQRCNNKNSKGYKFYGARGIKRDKVWDVFENFRYWSIGNGYSDELQLDRIDTYGNYSPGNCRWVTSKENNNNRRDNHNIEAFGENKTLAQWSEDSRCKVNYHTLKRRLKLGWLSEDALTLELIKHGKRAIERARKYLAFGIEMSLYEWSKDLRCRVTKNALNRRVLAGWPIEEAITTPNQNKKQTANLRKDIYRITAYNIEKTITEWLNDNRCKTSRYNIVYRINIGWSPEDAISTPTRKIKKSI